MQRRISATASLWPSFASQVAASATRPAAGAALFVSSIMLVFSAMGFWSFVSTGDRPAIHETHADHQMGAERSFEAPRAPPLNEPVRDMPHARGALLRSCPKHSTEIGWHGTADSAFCAPSSDRFPLLIPAAP